MKLVINNLKKSFQDHEILKNIEFTFESGKIYGLIGRNGAGKTTLFNCLSEVVRSDAGTVTLVKERVSTKLTADEVGFVTSTPSLPEFLTGIEFIKILLDVQNKKYDVQEYFKLVEIDKDAQNRLIKTYSHGMKNKLQMLCFIICNSPVMLLDEPLTSLDIVVAAEIKNVIRSIKKDHIIIFSTHILQLAVDLCDELIVLNEGKLSQIDHNMLQDKSFEKKVIDLLRDKENE